MFSTENFFKGQYPEALLVNLRTDQKGQRMKCLMPGEELKNYVLEASSYRSTLFPLD